MTHLKLLLFRAAYNLPVTLGLTRGVFARHGLDLEIAYTLGSQMVVDALRSGEHDVGVLAADDVVYHVEGNPSRVPPAPPELEGNPGRVPPAPPVVEAHGADLFMFMGLHGGILTLIGRPEIRTLADVAGKRLGVDDPASGFALVAHRILASAGVRRADYATVAAGGHEHRARALLDGIVDVALLTPPFTLQALARGFTTLAHGHQHLPAYQASSGVTTRAWARGHPSALVSYIRAYRESLDWTLDRRHRGEAIAHLGREFGLSAPDAEATYAALTDPVDGLFPDARIDTAGVHAVIDLRVEAGLLPPGPRTLERYLDGQFLAMAGKPSAR